MPRIQQSIRESISANSTENILSDTKLENVPTDDDYMVTVLMTADSENIEAKIEADTDVLLQPSPIGATLRRPQPQDDIIGQWPVTGGTKLRIEAEETGGAAQVIWATVILTPFSEL